MSEIEYSEGDKVLVWTPDGVVVVLITLRDEELKNGEPGWEGILQGDQGQTLWGYDSQIEKVL